MPTNLSIDYSEPRPSSILWLIPANPGAKSVVNDPLNSRFVSIYENNTAAFAVDYNPERHTRNTLVTLGRGRLADIRITPLHISRLHCSFDLNDLKTGVVMLHDHSKAKITRVLDDNAPQFHPSSRKIAIETGRKSKIGLGIDPGNRARGHSIIFDLDWVVKTTPQIVGIVREQRQTAPAASETIRSLSTIGDNRQTMIPSRISKIHTWDPKFRYWKEDEIGRGGYGVVYRAINLDNGEVVAAKTISKTDAGFTPKLASMLQDEIQNMAIFDHPHIVNMIFSQGWGEEDPYVEIFMGLKHGSLHDLIVAGKVTMDLLSQCGHEMLQALDHVAYQGIIHRDVKPPNILYTRNGHGNGKKYVFQLTDFGVSKFVEYAGSRQGTTKFMAPEVVLELERRQSPKADVWSLFVSLVFALGIDNYRAATRTSLAARLDAVRAAAKHPSLVPCNEMAMEIPEHRASAAQMLFKCFGGRGLTTPLDQIPPLEPYNDTHRIKLPDLPQAIVPRTTRAQRLLRVPHIQKYNPRHRNSLQGNYRVTKMGATPPKSKRSAKRKATDPASNDENE